MVEGLLTRALLFSLMLCVPVYAQQKVRVAQEMRPLYPRDYYLQALLQSALAISDKPYTISYVDVHPHQQRILYMLDGERVDVHWSMTSPAREKLAIAVKVPLFKGRIGQRVLLAHPKLARALSAVESVSQLRQFSAVQGHDWPDTNILAANNLPVKAVANYQTMFRLTAQQRVDYFPRSVIEVVDELQAHQQMQLQIVDHVVLNYPSAFYFFVSKNRPELAAHLRQGLDVLIQRGEFDALFTRYFSANLETLSLASRRHIMLANPFYLESP
ncbi:transporter substrate-binding domain-containing protein [Pseudoalteromonas sp. CnMc7-15]|nr:transporter substrate-binding domain-containing protein [Pseudoalteromonas sp. CnMc7-15]